MTKSFTIDVEEWLTNPPKSTSKSDTFATMAKAVWSAHQKGQKTMKVFICTTSLTAKDDTGLLP